MDPTSLQQPLFDDRGFPTNLRNLVMEVAVKWQGDPNITLAIEVPGG